MDSDTPGVTVREATGADVDAFAKLIRRAWEEAGTDAPGFAGATDVVIAELTTPEMIEPRIGGPDRRMFLAWNGDEAVGFCATRREDTTTVEMAGIIVLGSYSSRGIGTQLVREAIRRVSSESYSRMLVRTEIDNQRARGFYESLGFVNMGSTVEVVEDQSIEVRELERALT
jgi:ribosomal protein S18 acetylase RimI-like enzyme